MNRVEFVAGQLLEAYHHVREPLFRQIIAETLGGLPAHCLILDAGAGNAFYSRLITECLGPGARVVAFDLRREQMKQGQPPGPVHACQGDLEKPGFAAGSFDAIWLCRSMHSALHPVARLASLVPLLRPAGRFVVVENDFGHYPMLSWPPELESQVIAAHLQHSQARSTDGSELERYFGARYLPSWLAQAGLRVTLVQTYASHDLVPMPEEIEAYWSLFLTWLQNRIWPYLPLAQQSRYAQLCDPQSAEYVLRQPGFNCLELTTVACGQAPG